MRKARKQDLAVNGEPDLRWSSAEGNAIEHERQVYMGISPGSRVIVVVAMIEGVVDAMVKARGMRWRTQKEVH
jgi:hypothetical protein